MGHKEFSQKEIGDLGEGIAIKFLTKKGYKFIKQNVSFKEGELDIVMTNAKQDILHFFEVKTASVDFGVENLDEDYFWNQTITQLHSKKIQRLHKSIHHFLRITNQTRRRWQLDAVLVLLDSERKQAKCKHYSHISNQI